MPAETCSKLARWKALVQYRHDAGLINVEMFLEEIHDLHGRIERGPHWDTIHHIEIERLNHIMSPSLTVEQAKIL